MNKILNEYSEKTQDIKKEIKDCLWAPASEEIRLTFITRYYQLAKASFTGFYDGLNAASHHELSHYLMEMKIAPLMDAAHPEHLERFMSALGIAFNEEADITLHPLTRKLHVMIMDLNERQRASAHAFLIYMLGELSEPIIDWLDIYAIKHGSHQREYTLNHQKTKQDHAQWSLRIANDEFSYDENDIASLHEAYEAMAALFRAMVAIK